MKKLQTRLGPHQALLCCHFSSESKGGAATEPKEWSTRSPVTRALVLSGMCLVMHGHWVCVCVCVRSLNSIVQCVREANCVIPHKLRGVLPALRFFCDDEYSCMNVHIITGRLICMSVKCWLTAAVFLYLLCLIFLYTKQIYFTCNRRDEISLNKWWGFKYCDEIAVNQYRWTADKINTCD